MGSFDSSLLWFNTNLNDKYEIKVSYSIRYRVILYIGDMVVNE